MAHNIIFKAYVDSKQAQSAFKSMGRMARSFGSEVEMSTAKMVNTRPMVQGMQKVRDAVVGVESSVINLRNAFIALAGVVVAGRIVKAAVDMENALIGLNTVAKATGNGLANVEEAARDLAADGMIPLADVAASLKNLMAKGWTFEESLRGFKALRNAAAFNRQGQLSLGEAIRSASEGLKNNLSIKVDNAGVTENLSQMEARYAKSIGKGVKSLNEKEKAIAHLMGVEREAYKFTGDYDRLLGTFSGSLQKVSGNFRFLIAEIGEFITKNKKAAMFLEYLTKAVRSFRKYIRENRKELDKFVGDSIQNLIKAVKEATYIVSFFVSGLYSLWKTTEIGIVWVKDLVDNYMIFTLSIRNLGATMSWLVQTMKLNFTAAERLRDRIIATDRAINTLRASIEKRGKRDIMSEWANGLESITSGSNTAKKALDKVYKSISDIKTEVTDPIDVKVNVDWGEGFKFPEMGPVPFPKEGKEFGPVKPIGGSPTNTQTSYDDKGRAGRKEDYIYKGPKPEVEILNWDDWGKNLGKDLDLPKMGPQLPPEDQQVGPTEEDAPSGFSNVVNSVNSVLGKSTGLLSNISASVGSTASTALGILGAILNLPKIITSIESLLTNITNFPQVLGDSVRSLGSTFNKLITELPRNVFASVNESIEDGIFFNENNIKAIEMITEQLPDMIEKMADKLPEQLPKLASAILKTIPAVIRAIMKISVDATIRSTPDLTKATVKTIIEIWRSLFKGWKIGGTEVEFKWDKVNNEAKKFQTGWHNFMKQLTTGIDNLKTDIISFGEKVKQFFSVENLTEGWEQIKEKISEQLDSGLVQHATDWKNMGHEIQRTWWEIINGWKGGWKAVGEEAKRFLSTVESWFTKFGGIISSLAQGIAGLIHRFTSFLNSLSFDDLKDQFSKVFEKVNYKPFNSKIQEAGSAFYTKIIEAANKLNEKINETSTGALKSWEGGNWKDRINITVRGTGGRINKALGSPFAKGGYVKGSGNKDTVPATLTPGELVVDRTTGPQLRAFLNEYQKPQSTTDNNSVLENLLVQILDKLGQPMTATAKAEVNEQTLADIILELNRDNQRLTP